MKWTVKGGRCKCQFEGGGEVTIRPCGAGVTKLVAGAGIFLEGRDERTIVIEARPRVDETVVRKGNARMSRVDELGERVVTDDEGILFMTGEKDHGTYVRVNGAYCVALEARVKALEDLVAELLGASKINSEGK